MSGHLFFEKSLRKIWWKEKNAVSLHSLTRTRASALQAEGRRFESVNAHIKTECRTICPAFFVYCHCCRLSVFSSFRCSRGLYGMFS